jgi:cystathionine gamma-synthase
MSVDGDLWVRFYPRSLFISPEGASLEGKSHGKGGGVMSEHKRDDHQGGGFSTRSVHAGEDRPYPHNSLIAPVVQTATYTFDNTQDLRDFMEARMWGLANGRTEYGRYGNPTVATVERKVAALEGAQAAVLFASGMNAVTSTLLAFLRTGAHLVITDDAYRRTRQFCQSFLLRFGVECSVVPAGDMDQLEAAIRPDTRLIISESPTNPYLRVLDLERLGAIGRRHRVKTMIDATFATPVNQRPLEYGIDLVMHSATKYLSGHNDLLAGVIAGSEELTAMVRQTLWVMGGVADAHSAALLHRGLKTLGVRVRHQNETALRIAEFLEGHPAIERVWYPVSVGSSASSTRAISTRPADSSMPCASRSSPRAWAAWKR